MATLETDLEAGGYLLRVRQAGALDGRPIVHFHGTPGCRLELVWAEATAEAEGVRLITFDRPGYGRSPSAGFGLLSMARAALEVAEALGVERLWTMGQSGGGPFALATAFVAGDHVVAAGSASGAAPFMLVPGAEADMWEADKEGLRLLPTDPDGAVEAVASGVALPNRPPYHAPGNRAPRYLRPSRQHVERTNRAAPLTTVGSVRTQAPHLV